MRLQREAASKITFIQFLSSVAKYPVYRRHHIQKRAFWKPYENYLDTIRELPAPLSCKLFSNSDAVRGMLENHRIL